MVERVRCPRCSTVFPVASRPECPSCGLVARVRPAAATTTTTKTATKAKATKTAPAKRNDRAVIAVALVLLLLFAGVTTALVLGGGDGEGGDADAAGNGTAPPLLDGLRELDNATQAPPATVIPVTDNATVGGSGPEGDAPAPLSFQGSGAETTPEFETVQGLLRVTMTYRGDGYFGLVFRNLDDADVGRRALTAPEGDYDGARYVGLPPGRYVAEVASGDDSGAWAVTIEQVRAAAPPAVPVQATGSGDAAELVFQATAGEVTFRTTHTAPYGEFVVRLLDANGNLVRRGNSEAVASDFGDHSEMVRVALPADGVYFVDVQAAGDWSIEVYD